MRLVCVLTLVATAGALPLASHQLGPTPNFVTAMVAAVTVLDLLSMGMLLAEYHDNGDARLLAMGWAYLWSLLVMLGYALAFPGAIAADPPLAATHSVAPYLYVAWHGGFPTLLGLAWAPWPARWRRRHSAARRGRLLLAGTASVAAAAAATVAFVVLRARDLPALIHGTNTSAMTNLTAPIVLPLVVIACIFTVRARKERHGPERWAFVASLVCLCDLILTYYSRHRYSFGWYCGRTFTVIAAGVVLVAMLASFRRMKAAAEFNASHDHLTGLGNRRTAMARLDEYAGAGRRRSSSAQLSVALVDLDHFKRINDTYGHAEGDAVLQAVSAALADSVRAEDEVARIGGEEFLILLPGTDAEGASTVAEKIRLRVSGLVAPAVPEALTVSIGLAHVVFDGDPASPRQGGSHLLHLADEALYEAKAAGRDCVVVSQPRQSV